MKEKRNVSQMITKKAAEILLHNAAKSTDYCQCFFGEPKKNEQITKARIKQCLKKLER